MNRSRRSLKVGIYILAKELDNVDEVVGRCDTELTVSLILRETEILAC